MASLSNINGLFDVHSTGAILFSTSHGTSGQILRSNGNAAPTWVAASTVIGGPYLPIAGGVLEGATSTDTGINFTVGGNLFVTSTSTLTGALSGSSATFTDTITSTKAGINILMDGAAAAEGIRMTPDSSTTYPVFLRSTNPASGEASPWLYKEAVDAWGIWHNNPINSFDFTRSTATGIEQNVGGGTNTVMIRLNNTDGKGTFAGGIGLPGTAAQYVTGTGALATFPAIPQGDLTAITVGNGLAGTSLGGPIPDLTMSGSYTGTFTATSLATNSFLNNAGSLLFSAGTGTGTVRSLNLRTTYSTSDPSSVDASEATGITWGQRTDNNPYYIIKPTKLNFGGGNYSKLTLNWHTGIRIGGQKAYGGTKFYNDAPDIVGEGGVIMNVGVGNDNIGVVNALTVGTTITAGGVVTAAGGNSTQWNSAYANQGNYLPLAGGTLTGNLNGTTATFSGTVNSTATVGFVTTGSYAQLRLTSTSSWSYIRYQHNAGVSWDVGSYQGGNYQIRPGGSGTNAWLYYSAGYSQAPVSSRAPIFYDSNDTTYFLNPSASGGNALKTIGDWRQTSDGWSGEVGGKMQYHGTNWYIQAGASFIYRNSAGANQFYVDNTGTGVITNYLTGNNSLRAPIFYDSNNTTYYGDFASTNDSINIAGSLRAATYNKPGIISVSSGNTSAGASIAIQQETSEGWTAIFADFEPNTGWGLYHDNPSNHFLVTSESSSGAIGAGFTVPSRVSGNRTAYTKQLFDQTTGDFKTGRDGYAQTSFRAPIFYDSANTAYYTRPASSSYINTLQTAGQIQVGASGSSLLYIGGTSGNYFRFHTNNADTYFDMNCGNIYWRQGASTRFYFYTTTANMTINGSLTQNSDIRVKENIVEISDCISKIQAIRGVYYNRTDFNTDITKIGVIAQEVEEVLPELILEAPDTGLKSVAYAELTAVLINAIKEQQVIIDDLKSRIEILEL